jgi:hypothetical protein
MSLRPQGSALIAVLLGGGVVTVGAAVPEIVPTRVLPVDGLVNFQPSGLALVDGVLYTVSDKHSDAVYRLDLEADRAVASAARPIQVPERHLDLEGLASDEAGGFFLVSEECTRVLHVPRDGPSVWVTPDLRPAGQPLGLLVRYNATLEGIALLGPRHLLLAAERDARGLLEVDLAATEPRVTATRLDRTRFPLPSGRGPDFADLAVWHGRVFALLRNACVVCELERDPTNGGWREGAAAAAFTAIESDPRTRYRHMEFGLAEGLALDAERLFLVLDNNNDALVADPQDHRSRVLIFANPFAASRERP